MRAHRDDIHARARGIAAVLDHRVAQAETAEEALQLLKQGIQVALIDLDLPQTNGFDLIRVVRRQFPDVATIAVTGIYMQLYLDIARNVGAHAAARKYEEGKPLEAGEWLRLIASSLGDGAAA